MRRQVYPLLLAVGFALMASAALHRAEFPFTPPAMTAYAPAAGSGSLKPLTQGPTMDGFGAWAPDGKRIAFMRNGQLALIPATGGQPRRISGREGFWDGLPAWRRDGKLIAFVRVSLDEASAYIMTVNPITGVQRELLTESEPIGYVAWSRGSGDESILYYTRPQQLVQFHVKRKTSQVLATVDSDWEMLAGGLSISPDGKFAVYAAGPRTPRGAQYDLWQIRLDGAGTEPVRLTRGGGIMPSYDGTGRRLAYRNPRQDTGIHIMDLQTHQTYRAVPDNQHVMHFHPAFTPDGRGLLISQLRLDSINGQRRFTSNLYVHTLDPSGGD